VKEESGNINLGHREDCKDQNHVAIDGEKKLAVKISIRVSFTLFCLFLMFLFWLGLLFHFEFVF
jgi:hypothetical protein